MNPKIVFVIFIFALFLGIIFHSENLAGAVLIISLCVNFLTLNRFAEKTHTATTGAMPEVPFTALPPPIRAIEAPSVPVEMPPVQEPAPLMTTQSQPTVPPSSYSYINPPLLPIDPAATAIDDQPGFLLPSQSCATVDNLMVIDAQQRSVRDRRAVAGGMAKTADYYKCIFAKEFDRNDNLEWWNNSPALEN